MPTANARKGAQAERMVAKYLREQGFWMADRRLREGRNDDQGDIDGVPFTTIQVKYVESNRYAAWTIDTLKQRDTAGTPFCLLIRRVPRKSVEQWEALMPLPEIINVPLDEQESWTWVRMDLRLAVLVLKEKIDLHSRLAPSSPTMSQTSTGPVHVTLASSSAPSTERDTPASRTA